MTRLPRAATAASTALCLALVAAGCGGTMATGATGPAPEFTLSDKNPASTTWGQERSPSDVRGKVLLVYFANFA